MVAIPYTCTIRRFHEKLNEPRLGFARSIQHAIYALSQKLESIFFCGWKAPVNMPNDTSVPNENVVLYISRIGSQDLVYVTKILVDNLVEKSLCVADCGCEIPTEASNDICS